MLSAFPATSLGQNGDACRRSPGVRFPLMQVPADFSAMILDREGEAAREWLESLPRVIGELLDRWCLRRAGSPWYGMCAVVVPVRGEDGRRCALKVSWVDDETRLEPVALRAWAGRGAVALLRADEQLGAMLLERLDERRVLLDVPVQEALDIAAELLRALRVPAPPELTGIGDIAARWGAEFRKEWRRLGQPCPERLLSSAVDLCGELAGLASESWLLHGDYHYGNILDRGDDTWVVIDPKPLKGDAAYEVVPLLRNRWSEIRGGGGTRVAVRRRLERFAEVAELESSAVTRWCLVRSIGDAMWFREQGFQDREEISWDIARTMFEDL